VKDSILGQNLLELLDQLNTSYVILSTWNRSIQLNSNLYFCQQNNSQQYTTDIVFQNTIWLVLKPKERPHLIHKRSSPSLQECSIVSYSFQYYCTAVRLSSFYNWFSAWICSSNIIVSLEFFRNHSVDGDRVHYDLSSTLVSRYHCHNPLSNTGTHRQLTCSLSTQRVGY